MQPLSTEHVTQALDARGVTYTLLPATSPTPTSEDAAREIGCEVGQIAKSICFIIDGQPVLVVTSGDFNVDDRKLATRFSVGRKKVKLAKPDDCITIFGYEPGGVAPVGHRTPDIPVYIDEMLKRYSVVYAAAGSKQVNFEIALSDLQHATRGQFADVIKE